MSGDVDDTVVDPTKDRTWRGEELVDRLESLPGGSIENVGAAPRVGRFAVLQRVGKGGMGTVFAAYDERLDRKVALKILHRDDDEPSRVRVVREAQALAKLSHPNVVAVFEADEHEGRLYLAMEFIDGRDLARWREEEDPSAGEVLQTYVQAGRGLSAAHAAGLVHRDFKPRNVMIDREGKVKVLDFGLVRRDSDGEVPLPADIESSSSPVLDTDMTKTGTVLGTPAYMAPEQMLGARSDARADQFGFCVALWQALFGQRPFEGKSASELMANVSAGRLVEPRDDRGVGWVVNILRRGLEIKPEARWPSMDALLQELTRDRGFFRSHAWPLAMVGGLGVLAAVVLMAGDRERPCTDAVHLMAASWNPQKADELRSKLTTGPSAYAEPTGNALVGQLDDYAGQWLRSYEQACSDAWHGGQSQRLRDARYRCLARRKDAFDALVRVLDEGGPEVLERATEALAVLPSIDRCADVDFVTAEVPPPESPELAARVSELERLTDRVNALRAAGKPEQARALADRVVAEVGTIDYPPLRIDAYLAAGDLALERLDGSTAADWSERAYLEAWNSPPATTFRVHLALAAAYSDIEQHPAAEREARLARALADRSMPRDRRAQQQAHNTLGIALLEQGKIDEARDALSKAHELVLELHGPDHRTTATARLNLGALELEAGNYEESLNHLRETLRIWTQHYGPDHPDLALVHNNLGSALRGLGRFDEAIQSLDRSTEIVAAAYGESSPNVARGRINLGIALLMKGDVSRAEEVVTDGLAALERADPPPRDLLAGGLRTLGGIQVERKDFAAARRSFRRALAIREGEFGPQSAAAAQILENLAQVEAKVGNVAQAQALHEQILDIRQSLADRSPDDIANSQSNLGLMLAARGECARADPLLRAGLDYWATRTPVGDYYFDWFLMQMMVAAYCAEELGDCDRARSMASEVIGLGDSASFDDDALIMVLARAAVSPHPSAEQLAAVRAKLDSLDPPARALVKRWLDARGRRPQGQTRERRDRVR